MRFLTAGESHGPELVVIVEGMPAGVTISEAQIDTELGRRQVGYGRGARSTKIERDHAELVSGLADGRTTGAPIALRIVNRDFANQPEIPKALTAPRPGHADLAGAIKYGLRDFRQVRERASARETAARVAAGALARQLLAAFGTWIGSFVEQVGEVTAERHGNARPIGALDEMDGNALRELASAAETDPLRCPDPHASSSMRAVIDRARAEGETLGGTFSVLATDVPPGLGSYVHWDRKLDGRLAQAMCSIHAIKGVEFGRAFQLARARGSDAQDAIAPGDGAVARQTNHAGGLEGGVTNGEPLLIRASMKPLSSIRAPIGSVDFQTGAPTNPPYVRSDVCAVPAAAVVGEAMVAWVLAQAVVDRLGSDRLDSMLAAYDAARDHHLFAAAPPDVHPRQASERDVR